MQKLTLTVEEVAVVLGVSRSTAYEGVRTGQIPSIRIGRRVLVPWPSLEAMLAEPAAVLGNRIVGSATSSSNAK